MTVPARILVAGIGNIFLGDDAFGVYVAQELLRRPQPSGVRVVDFGIRGLDLVYTLLDGFDAVILIDAVPRGQAPGTLYVIEPLVGEQTELPPPSLVEGHSMDPEKVLGLVRAMGGSLGHILLVGCEPTPVDNEMDMQMDMSPAVKAAIEPAAGMVEALIAELFSKHSVLEVQHAHENIGLST